LSLLLFNSGTGDFNFARDHFLTIIYHVRYLHLRIKWELVDGRGRAFCMRLLGFSKLVQPAARMESMCIHRLWVIYICLSVNGSSVILFNVTADERLTVGLVEIATAVMSKRYCFILSVK
jgi:hypothetical protein